MVWKIGIKQNEDIIYIGKRWIKKNIPKNQRIPAKYVDLDEPTDLVDMGEIQLENADEPKHIWIAFKTGEIFESEPPLKDGIPQKQTQKPPQKEKKQKKEPPKEPKMTKAGIKQSEISLAEVKGIGVKTISTLEEVGIKSVYDLVSKDASEIADLLGRDSEKQIKKWQKNAETLYNE